MGATVDFDKLSQFLKEATRILPRPQERTIFSVGGKGYFENPTTDLLAFFLNPQEVHGFGGLLLRSFVKCMAPKEKTPRKDLLDHDLNSCEPPLREEATEKKNRIDLVLVGKSWVLAVENKIHHVANNPFDDYVKHLRDRFRDKDCYFAVLSPTGVSVDRQEWVPVAYKDFASEVLGQFGKYLVQAEFTKWTVFLREFLVHLGNVAVEEDMEEKQLEFVEKNYIVISQLRNLQDKYHQFVQEKGKEVLKQSLSLGDSEISIRVHNWSGGPAIRYRTERWNGESDMVIYISAADEGMFIQMYADGVESEESVSADAFATGLESWVEGRAWRCWRTTEKLKDHNLLFVRFGELAKSFDRFLQNRSSRPT